MQTRRHIFRCGIFVLLNCGLAAETSADQSPADPDGPRLRVTTDRWTAQVGEELSFYLLLDLPAMRTALDHDPRLSFERRWYNGKAPVTDHDILMRAEYRPREEGFRSIGPFELRIGETTVRSDICEIQVFRGWSGDEVGLRWHLSHESVEVGQPFGLTVRQRIKGVENSRDRRHKLHWLEVHDDYGRDRERCATKIGRDWTPVEVDGEDYEECYTEFTLIATTPGEWRITRDLFRQLPWEVEVPELIVDVVEKRAVDEPDGRPAPHQPPKPDGAEWEADPARPQPRLTLHTPHFDGQLGEPVRLELMLEMPGTLEMLVEDPWITGWGGRRFNQDETSGPFAFYTGITFQPEAVGTHTVGPISLQIGEQTVRSNSVTMQIFEGWNEEGPDVRLRVNKRRVTAGEPFKLSIWERGREFEPSPGVYLADTSARGEGRWSLQKLDHWYPETYRGKFEINQKYTRQSTYSLLARRPGRYWITRDMFGDLPEDFEMPELFIDVEETDGED